MRDVWNLALVCFIAACVTLVLACGGDDAVGEGDAGADDECTGESTAACLEEREDCIDDCPTRSVPRGCEGGLYLRLFSSWVCFLWHLVSGEHVLRPRVI